MSEHEAKQGDAGQQLHFNGVDGETGEYLFPPVTPEALYPVIRSREQEPTPEERALREEAQRWSELYDDDEYLGTRDGIDPNLLSQTGWGVVLPEIPASDTERSKAQAALLEALKPLLDHRRSLAGPYFRVFDSETGYRPQESAREWLARHGAPNDLPVDPGRGVPYYLLLVGSPEEIPFEFQYELDVEYAVGRLHFDTVEEYACYARSVLEAERQPPFLSRRVALFGTRNPGDIATDLSVKGLIEPLQMQLSSGPAGVGAASSSSAWNVETFLGEEATKARLTQLLGGAQTPALLFTATHGMGFCNLDHSRFESHTGSLICQEWPGLGHAPLPEHAFAAADIRAEARLLGMVAFIFACYGAGIPSHQDFPTKPWVKQRVPERIAHRPFLSRLPRRMLSHERGGALAVIGHIERAWGCSFATPVLGQGADLFADVLKRLMHGNTVGHALDLFNNRFSRRSVEISHILAATQWSGRLQRAGKPVSTQQLVTSWIETHDARNYVVLGDPAVRLRCTAP